MKVLVRFAGDNDYGQVLRAFGHLLLPRVRAEDVLTPEQVASWFNEIAFVLYEMVQCAGASTRYPLGADKLRTYLRIEPRHVYVGTAAVDEKLKDAYAWADSDAVLVDGASYARDPVSII